MKEVTRGKLKKIGVLTSGGDAPGMNTVIRAIVRTALNKNIEIIGIQHGYAGLLARDFRPLDYLSVSNIMRSSGTILYTSRSADFKTDAGIKKAATICREIDLDGIVAIGGDGTFRGARELSLAGILCIGVPGTIDNDIACSEYSIGFDTAINTVRDAIEKILGTVFSHERCFLIEVMGRDSGELALHTGIACGAIAVLIPEIEFSLDEVIARIQSVRQKGKRNFIIVVSEGVTKTKFKDKVSIFEMAEKIEAATSINTRADILGYMQRGGTPSTREHVIATKMGCHAVNLLEKGKGNRVVVMKNNEIEDMDIIEALTMKKKFDKNLYDIANQISL